MPKCRLNINNEKLYGREKELALLHGAYRRVEAGAAEVVFIEGNAGVGRSALVHKALSEEACFLGESHCDKTGGSSPLAEIGAAISELLEKIISNGERDDILTKIENNLEANEVDIICQCVPVLHDWLIDDESDTSSTDGGSGVHQQEDVWKNRRNCFSKNQFAVRNTLRLLTEYCTCPIIICIDDLQWADDRTIELLELFANDSEQKQFLFVGIYRDIDIREGNPLIRWRQDAIDPTNTSDLFNRLTVISLKGLEVDDINNLLRDLTHLTHNETLPLAEVLWSRSDGNMFFVKQLLDFLQNKDILVYDFSKFKWTWERDKVLSSTALADHVVDLVAEQIKRHPLDVQRFLQLTVCVGHKIDLNVLEAVKSAIPGDPLGIEKNLDFCINERLLERLSNDRVKFLHPKIREAAMSLMDWDKDTIEKLHIRIGELVWEYHTHKSHTEKVEDRLLFLCAEHISLGNLHITDSPMKPRLVQLYNTVGQKACALSAFATAAAFFEKGIDLIKENGGDWSKQIKLQVNYAEAQFYVGRLDKSLEAINMVLSHKPTKSERMRVNMIRLEIIKAECKLDEYVSASLEFLSHLGEKIARRRTAHQANREVQRTLVKLQHVTDADILKLPISKSIQLRVLNGMLIPLNQLGKRNMSITVMCRLVALTLEHGIGADSPTAFASFGALLIAEKVDLENGYRFGELALALAKRLDPKALDPKVVAWVYGMTKTWQLIPLYQCVDTMFQGHTTAMKQGDPFMAFTCANVYVALCYYSALDLRPILRDIKELSSQMLRYKQKLNFLQILPTWQAILNLAGQSEDPLNMSSGRALDRQHELSGNENKVGEQACWSFRMQIAFYLGDLEVASAMSAKLQKLDIGFMKAHFLYPARVFFFALIAIANARKTRNRAYKQEATKHILHMRQWVQKKAANLVHKLLILEAEYGTLEECEYAALREKYGVAISTATKSGFMQDAALASQLAGNLCLNMVDCVHYADHYIRRAHLLWRTWGALAVSRQLEKRHPAIFDHGVCENGERGNYKSRERFDPEVFALQNRRLSESDEDG